MSESPDERPQDLEGSGEGSVYGHGTPEEVLPPEFWPLEPWPSEAVPAERDLPGVSQLIAMPAFAPALAPAEAAQTEPSELPLFDSFSRPEILPPARIPHLGHLLLLAGLLLAALLCAGTLAKVALLYHLFGVSTADQATNDIHYTLGTELVLYLIAFAGCLMVFPVFWRKGFFAGIAWRGAEALRLSGRLVGAAFVCFLLALVNGWLLPGPADAPIDKIFRTPGAAWLLFAFGVTVAPFFEELVFRGFLLPAVCTACDWCMERARGTPPLPLGEDGQPRWSVPAMAIGAVVVSLPFAGMHGEQTGYSLGPFLLLVCVSLVLCWVRLSTRSLAASVVVHASYNFMLFSLMLLGTGGFRHLENM